MFSKLTGMRLAESLLARSAAKRTQFLLAAFASYIAVSAHAMSGDEAKARAAGCDDYLTKPIREELLFEKLTRFLGPLDPAVEDTR